MKSVALLIVAAFAFASAGSAQSPDQSGVSTTGATAFSRMSAEFTKKIDTKDAKVGDEVAARTTASITFTDGTELPKGTRLAGTVSEVRAKSDTQKIAHVAININRAILQDGHEIPLHVTLTSLSAPAPPSGAATPDMTMGTPNVGAQGGGRVSASSVAEMGGGLSGGTTGVTSGRGSKRGAASVPDSSADATLPGSVRTGLGDPRAEGSSATGTYVSDALQVRHYAVGNMPGVVLSSQATASVSGVLDAGGQNIRVESGSKMTMNAAIVAR
jgi:hypothetical protein